MIKLKRGLKAKSMGVLKAKQIVLDQIGIDSHLFDPAVSESKHDLGAFNVLIFIVNADINSISNAIPVPT